MKFCVFCSIRTTFLFFISFLSFIPFIPVEPLILNSIAGNVKFDIDARVKVSKTLPRIADNINVWEMGRTFYSPTIEFEEFNIFTFVKWVQLMQCSGGNKNRDLFKEPENREELNDYDFSPLINNCAGILSLGAKPYLKLGSVPLKLSKNPKLGKNFAINIYPPESYEQYYQYIKMLAKALVHAFGLREVRTWRFGCMTEYENKNWFVAGDENPESTFIAYCKLYDYTIQALTDVLGEKIMVGAHSMTCEEGLWDETRFIEHVAKGKNWANGRVGTKIDFLSISFYDYKPGQLRERDMPHTIKILQNAANRNGLNNVFFGIDEGRILYGLDSGESTNGMLSRSCGYTWQGAYDARLYIQALENDVNYISSWGYLTGGILEGYPSIAYHVAHNINQFEGYKRIKMNNTIFNENKQEIGCFAARKGKTVKMVIYSFSKEIRGNDSTTITIELKLPFKSKEVIMESRLIDDDCNFFDEWQRDRIENGISSNQFVWSPDDATIDSYIMMKRSAQQFYRDKLRTKYIRCSQLHSKKEFVKINGSTYKRDFTIKENTVLFLDIKK